MSKTEIFQQLTGLDKGILISLCLSEDVPRSVSWLSVKHREPNWND